MATWTLASSAEMALSQGGGQRRVKENKGEVEQIQVHWYTQITMIPT